jgi:HAD superfamily hydrolase (TIGR01509 family)
MKLYLVRHGETLWNMENRYQGDTDVPLSPKGEGQARQVRDQLAGIDFDAVYSSSMQRARRTAEIIVENRDQKVQQLPDVHEMALGEMEGVHSSEVHEKFPGVVEQWRNEPITFTVPGGESLQDVCDRTWPQLDALAAKHQGQNILLVAHHTVNKTLLCKIIPEMLGKTRNIRQGPCAINVLEIAGDQEFIHSIGMNWHEGESSWHDLSEKAKTVIGKLKAVIFDLDGVLVDSMRHYVAAWRGALAEHGIFPVEKEFYLREGEKCADSIHHFFAEAGQEANEKTVASIRQRLSEIYDSLPPAQPYDGAMDVVKRLLAGNYNTAIVTGSTRETLAKKLQPEQQKMFASIICQDDYENGKPHPEPYLKALKELGLEADECLVIENAPFGIASAKAAGCLTMALTNTLAAAELQQADMVMGQLSRIADWLAL